MGELDEKELAPTTESSPTTEVATEEPKETEKLLNNKKDESETPKSPSSITAEIEKLPTVEAIVDEAKRNGEEIIDVPETAPTAKTPVSQEGREVKPKKIPIGGIKMPGFFTKSKPKSEGDGADGELLENAGNEAKVAESDAAAQSAAQKTGDKPAQKSLFSTFRLKNPFARRPPVKPEDEEHKETKAEEGANGATKPPSQGATENDSANPPPPKKGLLNAIRLPIANIIPKKLRPVNGRGAEDLELGNGPNNKAGLASMETLDDSLKDTDNGKDVPDKAALAEDDMETVKLNDTGAEDTEKDKEKEKDGEPITEKPSYMERIRAYQCSVDDMAIVGGILIFILLIGIICAFVFTGQTEMTSAPIRDGKYIQAITSCGLVEGIMEDSAFAFRGIPYAVPPIGENRWRPAKVIDNIDECWNGTFKAHNSTQVCWQIYANGTIDGTEDCLKLDVITPHVRYDNPLPVVVLFGSESMTGDSPSKLRPSARYARARDVIFVRPNFRIGIFGFLALDTLSKSTHPPTSGNYALSDMIAVLKWVKLNIAHFGGNANAVTLFGHRAGATLVTALVSSPQAKDLFARAWVSSGAAIFPGIPLPESERANLEYLEALKCKEASCMRNAEDEELLDAVPDTWRRVWPDLPGIDENTTSRHQWLVLDGEILLQHPADVWNREPATPKLVIGTTMHESHSEKLFLKHKEWTPELVKKHVEDSKIGQLGLAEEALKLYNATYPGLVSMISDIRTICPLLTIARAQPSVPFYVVTQLGNGDMPLATVDDDVQAILGRYEPKTPEQRRYVSAIQQLFYHFVSHGEMKQFEARRRVLDIGQDALSTENYPNCDFWISKDVVLRYARLD